MQFYKYQPKQEIELGFTSDHDAGSYYSSGFDINASDDSVHYSIRDAEKGIRLSDVRREGFQVNASQESDGSFKKVVIHGVHNNVIAKHLFDIIASQNSDIIITYRDSLDEEAKKLARKTKKPLWFVNAENGTLVLERAF